MLVPFQTYMALTQLKQQQQQQATPTSAASATDKDKEVVQLDGTFPELGGGAGVEQGRSKKSGSGCKGGIVQLDGPPVESSSEDDSDMDDDSSEVSTAAF